MKGVRPVYKSYLLRLWKESNDGEWRVFLQNISTGECQNFSTLAALLEHLEHPASFVKNETKLPQEINRLA